MDAYWVYEVSTVAFPHKISAAAHYWCMCDVRFVLFCLPIERHYRSGGGDTGGRFPCVGQSLLRHNMAAADTHRRQLQRDGDD